MTVSALAALASAILIVHLAHHRPARLQWSPHHRYELSPATLHLVRGLQEDVEAIVYARRDEPTGLHSSILLLLEEYALHSPRIHVRQVDYVRDRATAQAVAEAHRLSGEIATDMVLLATPHRRRTVGYAELRELQVADRVDQALSGREIRRVGFRGEQLFTSAIRHITSGGSSRVSYLEGHGEHNPGADYSGFTRLLEEKNFRVIPTGHLTDISLLEGTALLVIAGPRSAFSRDELEVIDAYLHSGGRLLLLHGWRNPQSPTGLDALLRGWGLRLGTSPVDDEGQRMGADIVVREFARHPVTIPLVEAGLGLQLFRPRSVAPFPGAARGLPGWQGQSLAFTSPRGRSRGLRGPVPLMAAVEVEHQEGPATRILAIGDSRFLADDRIDHLANRNLATLAAGWLTDEFGLIQGIDPQPIHQFRLSLTDGEIRRLAWWMLVVGPGTILSIGFGIWFRRRR